MEAGRGTDGESTRASLPGHSSLRRLGDLAEQAGIPDVAADAGRLDERLAESRFYVACIGQFKRGKSTLINALLGEELLPVGVVPVTNLVTVIRHGPRSARVRFAGSTWREIPPAELAQYVTEERNPRNTKNVAGLELFHPSPFLAHGLCLVDTPGVGSVFPTASAVTREFVPHIDACIVVVGGDPPLSGDEAALVECVAAEVREILVILNKADRLAATERNEAKSFTRRILSERLGRDIGPILEVSATERLSGATHERDWPALLSRIESLANDAGSDLIAAAQQRGAARIADRLLHELDEQTGALTRPIEDSERRIDALKQCAAAAQRSMTDLSYLLDAEQARLNAVFADGRERFLALAIPQAKRELAHRFSTATALHGQALRRHGNALAQEIYREWVERWRSSEAPIAERLYREAAGRFVELVNGFLAKLADSGQAELARLPRSLDAEVGFRVRSGLFYTEMMTLTTRSPFAWLADLVRTSASVRTSAESSAAEYLDRLLAANTARIRSDFDERVLESRRRLEAEVRGLLREVHASAERALAAMRVRLACGEAAVQSELRRITELRVRVLDVLASDPTPTSARSAS